MDSTSLELAREDYWNEWFSQKLMVSCGRIERVSRIRRFEDYLREKQKAGRFLGIRPRDFSRKFLVQTRKLVDIYNGLVERGSYGGDALERVINLAERVIYSRV